MNTVHAQLHNINLKIDTDLDADKFFSEYKYLEFNGQLYVMIQMIKSRHGTEAKFERYNGPINKNIKKLNKSID